MLAKNEQFHVLLLPSINRVQAPGSWMGSVPYIRLKLGGWADIAGISIEHYIVRKVCETSWTKHLVLV